ncbi:MAG: radical SAM protein [Clostridia bacterium]
MKCNLCPQNCNINRSVSAGFCKTRGLSIARVGLHQFEEPCISGERGSGTIFFSGCNMRCVFCQNYNISHTGKGVEIDERQLAEIMLYVQEKLRAENINLVSPAQFSDKIATALRLIKDKLTIPVIYNTNGYEKVESLRALDKLVDVYLPDFKYADNALASRLSGAQNYFETACASLQEMRRQQPSEVFVDGMIKKGVIVRLLVLPTHTDDAKRVLDYLASFDKSLYVSVMAQYFPTDNANNFAELSRRITKREYQSVLEYFDNVGLVNGYSQQLTSATEEYVPEFNLEKARQLVRDINEEK